ncbi:hypothetical protein [Paenirhodobacter populi]|nr:hypothetical protein [Sinirhodobacter populi]
MPTFPVSMPATITTADVTGHTNEWQTARIRAGVSAARDGKIVPADEVFAAIASKHDWPR